MSMGKNKSMNIKTNIIISRSSFSNSDFKEAVDLGLVCAAFDQEVNLIFVDSGITNLIKNQSAEKVDDKNQVDILKGLEFYDIDNIIIEQESLNMTSIEVSHFIDVVKIISRAEINQLNQNANHLVNI